ncbi:M43 family zinc metalloprotease [Siphonobacter sp. SORGH_AS_1065]|uniref:M43 family zinc metalloprotease n=1 Tax=Siphonobacter sp. SORGH_AS_1065 TaxID=3041795 RepID=UPI0027853A1F|nr:M43 family zinc metalloprotease [Siphonobacter sp. SORGH_AS_1065]MDQ1090430.1 hypothetical protein [Siphonobacter sp. SORGH_AS_1065]
MKVFYLFTALAVASLAWSANGQTCGTNPNVPNNDFGASSSYADPTNDCEIRVNVFIHLVGRSDGSNRPSSSHAYNIAYKLGTSFSPWKITIDYLGYDEINSDTYGLPNSLTLFNYTNLFSVNAHSNAIDIYVVPQGTTTFGAAAAAIPSKALVVPLDLAVNASGFPTEVTSHELGHCFNLFHTFHGTAEGGSTPELANGSNNTTAGDFIPDTPADPVNTIGACVNNCSYSPNWLQCNTTDANGHSYAADLTNIMSYGPINCLSHYTPHQAHRMRTALRNASVLAGVRTLASSAFDNNAITVDNVRVTSTPVFVSPGSHSVRLNTFGNLQSISWSANPSWIPIYTLGAQCDFTISSGQSLTLNVTATTSCGGPQSRSISFSVPYSYKVYPNTATNVLNVEFEKVEYEEGLPDEVALISERSQKIVRSVKVREAFRNKNLENQSKVVFDVKNLARGRYYLKVNSDHLRNSESSTTRILLVE